MAVEIDHLILKVNDRSQSIAFYCRILGFESEGEDGPFSVIRVAAGFTIQLAPWGTSGGEHLAFAMTRAEFDGVFQRVRESGVSFGDAFDSVGSNRGPGEEGGARGLGTALYFFDPNEHLIEIRHYET